MAINSKLVLAGISGQTGTPSLAWFGPDLTPLPTDAATALNAGFLDLGIVEETGAVITPTPTTVEIDGYGMFSAARVITTKESLNFKIIGRETNAVSLNLYNRLPLTGTGTTVVTPVTGVASVNQGPARSIRYTCVLDATDGPNKVRKVFPSVELTGKDPETISRAANLAYGMMFSAYPDANGVAMYTYYVLDALK